MMLPSLSRLDVADICVFPWQGRAVWPKRVSGRFATFGTATSLAAQCVAVWGDAPVDAIADVNGLNAEDRQKLLTFTADVRRKLAEEAATTVWRKAEVALGYDVVTGIGRELTVKKKDRDYFETGEDEQSGTPDLVTMFAGGRLRVTDYKSGRYKRGHRPGKTLQLRALAAAAASAYGVGEVEVELVQIDDDGSIREPSPVDVLDEFDLAGVAEDLRALRRRIAGPAEAPRPGWWCTGRYCPVVATCPATAKALLAIDRASELRFPLSIALESAEHAGYVLERLDAVEKAVDTIRQAVKDYAKRYGPVPVGDGKVYGPILMDGRESVDLTVAGAEDLIRQVLGEAAVEAVVEKSTSKAAIERYAKATQEKRGAGVNKARDLYALMRESGVLRQGAPFERFDRFLPTKKESDDV